MTLRDFMVVESDLSHRRARRNPTQPYCTRDDARLYIGHVTQTDKGACLDFPVGKDIRLVTRESH